MQKLTKAKIIFGFISLVMTLAASAAENPVIEFAHKKGLKKCLTSIAEQSDFLIGGQRAITKNTLLSDNQNPNPHAWVLVSNIESSYLDASKFSSLTVSPFGDACMLNQTEIMHFTESCESARLKIKLPKTWTINVMKHVTVAENTRSGISIFFVPVFESSCMVITRDAGILDEGSKGESK